MQHGSLQNKLYGAGTDQDFEVGDGVTVIMWTDRHAATVIEKNASGKTLTIQEDTATRIDGNGMSDAQEYSYESNPQGRTHKIRRNRKGVWKTLNTRYSVVPGRRHYFDFSF